MKGAHLHAHVHAHLHRLQVVAGGGVLILFDSFPQARIDLLHGVVVIGLEDLAGTGEPEHVERLHRVLEAGVHLLDDRTALLQCLHGIPDQAVHLRVVGAEPEVSAEGDAQPLQIALEALHERGVRRRQRGPVPRVVPEMTSRRSAVSVTVRVIGPACARVPKGEDGYIGMRP